MDYNKIKELKQSIVALEKNNKALKGKLDEMAKYQFISNAAEDLMTLINKKYEYVAVNNSYCRQHAKNIYDILGKKVAQVWGKKSFNMYIKDILKRCFKGEIVRYQDWFEFENDKTGFYDVVYYPYYDEFDSITHVAVVTRDITKLKNTELDLQKSEDKYRNLIDSSFDMIFRMNVNYIFTFVSSASKRLFNLFPDSIIGKDFSEVFFSDEKNGIQILQDTLVNGKNIEAVKLRIKTGGDDYNYIEINALPLFENNQIIGFQGIIRDLALRMKLEKKQKELEAELMKEHRLASIGLLTSGLAHNIRSPLTAIMGAVQLIQMGGTAQKLDVLNIIQTSAKKIELITDSMMDKLRKEQDEKKVELNINDVLKNELEILKSNLVFKHSIEKDINLSEYIPNIWGVYNNFSQAFANIIQNAMDSMYGKEEKVLKVKTILDDDRIIISIIDSGCGIKKENISKLFDPFYTSKPKSVPDDSDEPKGTGLGLYSCYNMLKPYKIKLHVTSQLQLGTTFDIVIPVKINQIK